MGNIKTNLLAIILAAISLCACSGGGSSGGATGIVESPPETAPDSDIFPTNLAVSSPFDLIESTAPNQLYKEVTIGGGMRTRYSWAVRHITNALDGSLPVRYAFKPYKLYEVVSHASCFAPSVIYKNHPNGAGPNNGQIPAGELGVWQEIDASSGHACAAAELNNQLLAMSDHTRILLMMVASTLLDIRDSVRFTLPGPGQTLDVTSEIDTSVNRYENTGMKFNSVTVTQNIDGSWNYLLDFDHTRSWDNSGTFTHHISVLLKHFPNSSNPTKQYEGLLNYRVSGGLGETHFPGTNCPNTENRTLNGSLKYHRISENQIKLQSRFATFCGDDVNGLITSITDDDGMVDDDFFYDGSNNGWSENFVILLADYNPTTLSGNYINMWQAGPNEPKSNIFAASITESNNTLIGNVFFGYGDPISNTNGNILNFICNSAGPDGGLSLTDRTFNDRLQYQDIVLDTNAAIFIPNSNNASYITYAPTNGCDYDGSAPYGEFLYDTDSDGDLSDETDHAVTNNLWKGTIENQANGDTLPDIINALGIFVTTPPGGLPSDN